MPGHSGFLRLGDMTTDNGPGSAALEWAAGILDCAEVTTVRGMREGGTPWLIQAGEHQAVLRAGDLRHLAQLRTQFVTEAAALEVAAKAGLPVPALLGHDDDALLMLLEWLPGASHIPAEPGEDRLRAIGAAAARIHAVDFEPSEVLPLRERPIADVDFARIRREHGASTLLIDAERIVADSRPPAERVAFTHGDLWHGNTLWDGGELSALLDWDAAGAGAAGVDLGSLRCDAAICYDLKAADLILAGWEAGAGRRPENLAYWDAVAALASPPDMGWVAGAIADQGRPDLDDGPLLTARRDAFLRQALSRLIA
jgi:aminoglycoside phosphotransferase (APT) family kinase protein